MKTANKRFFFLWRQNPYFGSDATIVPTKYRGGYLYKWMLIKSKSTAYVEMNHLNPVVVIIQ